MSESRFYVEDEFVIDRTDGSIRYDDMRGRVGEIVAELLNYVDAMTARPQSRVERAREAFALLTDTERLELIHSCCTECGTKDGGCQCWNDE